MIQTANWWVCKCLYKLKVSVSVPATLTLYWLCIRLTQSFSALLSAAEYLLFSWQKCSNNSMWTNKLTCFIDTKHSIQDTELMNRLMLQLEAHQIWNKAEKIKTVINRIRKHCSDMIRCHQVSLLHAASNVWEMRCMTRTTWVRYQTNTQQMEGGRHQLADMFQSTCRDVFWAFWHARHASVGPITNPLRNVIRVSDLSNSNQCVRTQSFKCSKAQFTYLCDCR